MGTDRDPIRILEPLPECANQLPVFRRSLITDSVRYIHNCCTRIDYGIEYRAEVIDLGATGIFSRKLHFIAKRSRSLDGFDRNVKGLTTRLVEFVLEVNVACRKEGVDARASRLLQGLPAAVNIGGGRSGEPGDGDTSGLCPDPLLGLAI